MRKISLFLLLLLVAALVACTAFSKPENTVATFFKHLKKADFENAHKHVNSPLFENVPEAEKELLTVYFSTIKTSNIKLVNKTDNTATINVDITAVDIIKVVQNFMVNMADKLANEGLNIDNVTDEELDSILIKDLKSQDAPRKSITAWLTLNKSEGKWILDADNHLRAALFVQEYNSDAANYEGSDFGYSVFETVNSKAIFTGADEMMGICNFTVENVAYPMYCEPEHMSELIEKYNGKEIEIVYQVLHADTEEGSEEEPVTLYLLEKIVK